MLIDIPILISPCQDTPIFPTHTNKVIWAYYEAIAFLNREKFLFYFMTHINISFGCISRLMALSQSKQLSNVTRLKHGHSLSQADLHASSLAVYPTHTPLARPLNTSVACPLLSLDLSQQGNHA